MALVHDDDLARIDVLGDGTVSEDLYGIPAIYQYFLACSHQKTSNQMRY
jgi:hypothetical protein